MKHLDCFGDNRGLRKVRWPFEGHYNFYFFLSYSAITFNFLDTAIVKNFVGLMKQEYISY